MAPTRFDQLPRRHIAGRRVPVATSLRARTLGLSHLDREDAGPGLLIPRCAAVHTFGMRFALDIHFLDADGAVLGSRLAVPSRRFVAHRGAAAVLEVPAE
jgi:uncharacterized membrane protein (UPF0127 family)